MSLITPRGSRCTHQMTLDNYAPFYAGAYRAERNTYLILARANTGDERHVHTRAQFIKWARDAHLNFLRCLREYRREVAMREAA